MGTAKICRREPVDIASLCVQPPVPLAGGLCLNAMLSALLGHRASEGAAFTEIRLNDVLDGLSIFFIYIVVLLHRFAK